jgi:hypothetical protein
MVIQKGVACEAGLSPGPRWWNWIIRQIQVHANATGSCTKVHIPGPCIWLPVNWMFWSKVPMPLALVVNLERDWISKNTLNSVTYASLSIFSLQPLQWLNPLLTGYPAWQLSILNRLVSGLEPSGWSHSVAIVYRLANRSAGGEYCMLQWSQLP